MPKVIFHVDVNSAFLSWTAVEKLRRGETQDIRLIPSAIGGDSSSRRGVILAKSTPAKAYGVVTGEPIGMAMQKCPELVCFPPDFSIYREFSGKMFEILSRFSDRVEHFSIDEGFLDYTGMEAMFGPYLQAAQKIKDTIYEELGFTVNVGVSSNKLLAKMAGELKKPNQLITLFPQEIEKKLWPLPVGELFMVGRRTVPHLKKLGICTIGDLALYPLNILEQEFKSYGRMLHAYANGIDDSPVTPTSELSEVKTIGNSTTVAYDITDRESALRVLLSLAETVSARLRAHDYVAYEIAVVLKSFDFHSYSHQIQLLSPADCTNAVYEAAKQAFDITWKKEPLRLLGIRAGKLSSQDCIQLSLTEKDWSKERAADISMDRLRKKYGKQIVQRSVFLHTTEKKELPRTENTKTPPNTK